MQVTEKTKNYIESKAKRHGNAKSTGMIWNELADLVNEPDHDMVPVPEKWETFDHLPEWTDKQATAYYRGKGIMTFNAVILNRQEAIKRGNRYGIEGFRKYIKCDDGNWRFMGDALARRVRR